MDKDDKDDEKDDEDSNQNTLPSSPAISCSTNKSDEDTKSEGGKTDEKKDPFPSASDINCRLRRLITSYQRNNKKLEMRNEAKVRVSV